MPGSHGNSGGQESAPEASPRNDRQVAVRWNAAQIAAIAARGDVLVAAGAGTGKTATLVARCVELLVEGASIERILLVTFTEAAAFEMRLRLREALQARVEVAMGMEAEHLEQQLALLSGAPIGTLHSYCLRLVRENYHRLGVEPGVAVLDEGPAQLLWSQAFEREVERELDAGGESAAAMTRLLRCWGGGRESGLRELVLAIHQYSRSLPDARGWLEVERRQFGEMEPRRWVELYERAVGEWRREFLSALRGLDAESGSSGIVRECLQCLEKGAGTSGREAAESLVRAVAAVLESEAGWPKRGKTTLKKQLKVFIEATTFLASWARGDEARLGGGGADPLASDWGSMRGVVEGLLGLVLRVDDAYGEAKRGVGGLDFSDLEQKALSLLVEPATGGPTALALECRAGFDYVFVDECQDINAAQDAVIRAVSGAEGTGNRFLVGDVKQSIYRFRLAKPEIFRSYESRWRDGGVAACRIALTENFRSRPGVLAMVNALFGCVMTEESCGMEYEALKAGRGGEVTADCGPQTADGEVRAEDGGRKAVDGGRATEDGEVRGGCSLTRPAGTLSPFVGGEGEHSVDIGTHSFLAGGERKREGATATDLRPPASGHRPLASEFPPLAPGVAGPDVELHWVERRERGGSDEEAGDELDVELEARLVARRFRELLVSGFLVRDRGSGQLRPVQWRDMAVLLRAPAPRVECFALEFARAGIPLVCGRNSGATETPEAADLRSLLQILDNPMQDWPLVAVLRSPLGGMSPEDLAWIRVGRREGSFWEALLRCWREGNRGGHLLTRPAGTHSPLGGGEGKHSADTHSADIGTLSPLGGEGEKRFEEGVWLKVDRFVRGYRRWRRLARLGAVSECLEAVLAETHYEALLHVQTRAEQRVANVRHFVELARRFDPLQRQGLFRFLRHLASAEEGGGGIEAAPVVAADAVRLMSVHMSKGLEFPVVAVACLGATFNMRGLSARVFTDDALGLCPQVVAASGRAAYPSVASWLAVRHERRARVAEEMRLLYVALTRACDRLILSGLAPRSNEALHPVWRPAHAPIDWIAEWLRHTRAGGRSMEGLVSEFAHARSDLMSGGRAAAPPTADGGRRTAEDGGQGEEAGGQSSEGGGQRSEEGGLGMADAREAGQVGRDVAELARRVGWVYAHGGATLQAGKMTVTELRRAAVDGEGGVNELGASLLWGETTEPQRAQSSAEAEATDDRRRTTGGSEEKSVLTTDGIRREATEPGQPAVAPQWEVTDAGLPAVAPQWEVTDAGLPAVAPQGGAKAGEAVHRFMQWVEFERTGDEGAVRNELARLVEKGRLEAAAAALVDVGDQVAFWQSAVGCELRACGESVNREVPFTFRLGVEDAGKLGLHLASGLGGEEYVVVQGVADVVVKWPEGLWLLDYKTDAVQGVAGGVEGKAAQYAPQLRLYALALSRIYGCRVVRASLCFLRARKVVEVDPR